MLFLFEIDTKKDAYCVSLFLQVEISGSVKYLGNFFSIYLDIAAWHKREIGLQC